MVLNTPVIEDVTSNLASPLYLLLSSLYLCFLRKSLLHSPVVKLALEQKHGLGTVLGLVTGLGILDEYLFLLARVRVLVHISQTYSRLHLIDILATGST